MKKQWAFEKMQLRQRSDFKFNTKTLGKKPLFRFRFIILKAISSLSCSTTTKKRSPWSQTRIRKKKMMKKKRTRKILNRNMRRKINCSQQFCCHPKSCNRIHDCFTFKRIRSLIWSKKHPKANCKKSGNLIIQ